MVKKSFAGGNSFGAWDRTVLTVNNTLCLVKKCLRKEKTMLKKVFTLFLVSCFLLNTVSLSVLTANTQPKAISDSEVLDFTNKISDFGFNPFLDYGQKEELINAVNDLLEILENLDTSDKPYINELMQSLFGNSSVNEFKETINRYFQEYMDYEINQVIVPGCLAPYSLAWIQVWVFSPYAILYSISYSLSDDNACSLMYAASSLMFLSLGFSSWTNYRICAEENSDNPDQDTINKLSADKAFMSAAAVVLFFLSLSYAIDCDVSPFYED